MKKYGRGFFERFRKALLILPLFAVILGGLAFALSLKFSASAADVSGNFRVTEAHAYKDDAETQELDSTNGINPGPANRFKLKLKWKYESDTPIEDGDMVNFELASERSTRNSRLVNNPDMASQDILDELGRKVGIWEIKKAKAYVTFSDAAVGRTSVEGELTTPRNLYFGGVWRDDMVAPVTVGNMSLSILIPGTPSLPKSGDDANKVSSYRGNDRVLWEFYSPGITINELYRGNGRVALSNDAKLSNLIVEDAFDEAVTSIELNTIDARATLPTEWTTGDSSTYGVGANLKNLFTEKTQASGQTYDDFKSSLKEMEWGVYRDPSSGRLTMVMNLGSQPSSKTYEEVLASQNSAHATMGSIVNAYYPYATVNMGEVVDSLTGNSNVVGGKIVMYSFSFYAHYPQASIETPISNTATFSWDTGKGEHKVTQRTAGATLVVGSASSQLKGNAKLYLRDKATKLPIEGATLKLQVLKDGQWEDFANGVKVTSSDGSVLVSGLESGTKCRWLQTGYTDHYIQGSFAHYSDENMQTVTSEFTMPDDVGVATYASNEREVFKVTYKAGEHGDFADIVFDDQRYGATTPQPTSDQIKAADGDWIFVGWWLNVSNVVTGDAVYTALWQNSAEKKDVNVAIIWEDENNRYGIRPDSVKVQLLQNEAAYGEAIEVSKTEDWKDAWTGLAVYNDGGEVNIYSIKDDFDVSGYTSGIEEVEEDSFVIRFKAAADVPKEGNPKTFEESLLIYFVVGGAALAGIGCSCYAIRRRLA